MADHPPAAARPAPACARAALGALLLCAAATAAQAQRSPAEAHYARQDEGYVRSIEDDLIWIGERDMRADGVIGSGSLAAIRRFERDIGTDADGILRREERRALARRAQAARDALGYRVVDDRATGTRVGVPFALVGGPEAATFGARYRSPGGDVEVRTYRIDDGRTLRSVYDNQRERADERVLYETFDEDGFAVVGLRRDGQRFHTRAERRGGEIRLYSLLYDADLRDRLGPLALAMSSDFDPFGGRRGAVAPPVAAAAPCGERIRVPAGDTLARIAARCGTTVERLRRANGGLDPLDLQAGQTLRIPSAGEALPTLAELAPPPASAWAFHLPSRPAPGGVVTVAAGGFPPAREVEASFARDGRAVPPFRRTRSDADGRVEIELAVPPGLRAGDRAAIVLTTLDGAHAASTESFALAAPASAPTRAARTLTGMLTDEGGPCPTLRDVNGRLWHLEGGLATGYAAGTPVEVTGVEAADGRCGTAGRTIEADAIARR